MNNLKPRVCLFEPRIPQNTGNISRSCAAFKYKLDLIEPLGFSMEDKYLKRAGLDYWEYVNISIYNSFSQYINELRNMRLVAFSKSANTSLVDFKFTKSDILLFGREDNGLPEFIKNKCHAVISIPMPGGVIDRTSGGVRSLNLSVSCGIAIYKSFEQLYLY